MADTSLVQSRPPKGRGGLYYKSKVTSRPVGTGELVEEKKSRTHEELRSILTKLEGQPYRSYRDIEDSFQFPTFELFVDHVQADPFAPPSRFRVQVPQQNSKISTEFFSNKPRKIACSDFITRVFFDNLKRGDLLPVADKQSTQSYNTIKGGEINIDLPGQHVIERTSVLIDENIIEARFTVSLPGQGRTILGLKAVEVICDKLPVIIRNSLFGDQLDKQKLKEHVNSIEDQEHLRSLLEPNGLVAFIREGAILPRQAGNVDTPMNENDAIKFISPNSLIHEFELPNKGKIKGMGIKKGITAIVGGGFHGKSTLLNALSLGVYNHIPGDGREFVVSQLNTVKINSETGRNIESVDISMFISNLPYGKPTDNFCTTDSSGNTSQAANLIEALEIGATTLLIDEDNSASNFLTRDQRMSRLVVREKEPITPFVQKAKGLSVQYGVSSIVVLGGSGDIFDVADTVIMMDSYLPKDMTEEARQIAKEIPSGHVTSEEIFGTIVHRYPQYDTLDSAHILKEKVLARSLHHLSFGESDLDLSGVEQLVEKSQTRAIGDSILYIRENLLKDGEKPLSILLKNLENAFNNEGLDVLGPKYRTGFYVRPRTFEIVAGMNRLRTLKMKQKK